MTLEVTKGRGHLEKILAAIHKGVTEAKLESTWLAASYSILTLCLRLLKRAM